MRKKVQSAWRQILAITLVFALLFQHSAVLNVFAVEQPKSAKEIDAIFSSTVEENTELINISAQAKDLNSQIINIKLPNGDIVEGNTATYQAIENGEYLFEVFYTTTIAQPIQENSAEEFTEETENVSVLNTEEVIIEKSAVFTFVATKVNSPINEGTSESVEKLQNMESETYVSPRNAFETYMIFDESSQTITGYSSATEAPRANMVIPDTIRGVKVKHIGANAFAGNMLTDSLTIECTELETIGANAFKGNFITGTVIVPEGVTTIGVEAFGGTTMQVTNYTLPSTLTNLGNAAFNGNAKLENITLPAGVTRVGDSLFSGCANLQNVVFQGTITYIGGNAFYGCKSLNNFVIPEGVTSIGSRAFAGANMPLEITLPSTLVGENSISAGAFEDTKFTKINIPHLDTDTIKNAPWGALSANIIWKDTLSTDDGKWLFYLDSTETSKAILTKYIGLNVNVEMPINIEKDGVSYPVKGFIQSTFYDNKNIETIDIKSNIINVPESAFQNCGKLTSVILPNTVENIGRRAFTSTGISTFEWPNGVKKIESGMFSYSKISSFTIPSHVEEISGGIFESTSNLTSVIFEDTSLNSKITSIPDSMFNSSGITNIVLPESIKSIGQSSFRGTRLQSIVIPANVETIHASAFEANSRLTLIDISVKEKDSIAGAPWSSSAYIKWAGETTSADGNWVYNTATGEIINYIGPSSITEIVIPSSIVDDAGTITPIKGFVSSAFSSLKTTLQKVVIQDGIEQIPTNAFSAYTNLETVHLPESILNIGSSAFANSKKLKQVNIPSKLTIINDSTFQNCTGLEHIDLPEGLKEIRTSAFAGCSSLGVNSPMPTIPPIPTPPEPTIKLPSTLEKIYGGAFANCTELKVMVIPDHVTTLDDGNGVGVFQNATNLEYVLIGRNVRNIASRTFTNTPKLTTLNVLQNRDRVSITHPSYVNAQPWGASSSITAHFLGEIPELVLGERTFITGKWEEKIPHRWEAYIQIANIYPFKADGTQNAVPVNVGVKNWPAGTDASGNPNFSDFIATANGDYWVGASDASEPTKPMYIKVSVTDIGKVEVTGNNFRMDVSQTTTATKDSILLAAQSKDILNGGNLIATTREKGENFNKNWTISDSDIAKVKALTSHGQQAIITITVENAEVANSISGSITLTVTATEKRNVSYETNGGTPGISSHLQVIGDVIPEIATGNQPHKAGYSFSDWYTTSDYQSGTKFVLGSGGTHMPAQDIILYAKWTPNTDTAYKVEHYKQNIANNNYTLSETENLTGTTDTLATAVEKSYAGYVSNTTNSVMSGNIKGDGTQVLKVYYDRNPNTRYSVEYYYENKTMDGYTLHHTDTKFGLAFDTVTLIPEVIPCLKYKSEPTMEVLSGVIDPTIPLRLKVYYEREGYIVTFDTQEGSVINSQRVIFEELVRAPSTQPVKHGNEFMGWYKDKELTQLWNFNTDTMPGHNLTLYAGWLKYRYPISFWDWDDTIVFSNQIPYGDPIGFLSPITPKRPGYVFKGWSPEVPKTMPEHELRFRAIYEKVVFDVTFVDYDGTVIEKQSIKKGKDATAPKAPTREGYTFKEWDKSFENVRKDLKITAVYEKQANVIITPEDDTNGNGTNGNANEGNGGNEVVNPEVGNHGEQCILHWFLWAATAILAVITLVKRRNNKKELEDQ